MRKAVSPFVKLPPPLIVTYEPTVPLAGTADVTASTDDSGRAATRRVRVSAIAIILKISLRFTLKRLH
jgi:hypothetical protein